MSDDETISHRDAKDAQERAYLNRAETIELVTHRQADPGLRADLEEIAGDTTNDLDDPR